MTDSPVRWALVGYGSGGRVFHGPMLDAAGGVDLVAVVTGSAARQAEVARRLPDARTVPDLNALTDLGVTAVTITTPPGTHTDLAHQAVELGLDVVVDKPFALTETAARELVDHARSAGTKLTVYQNRRWDSDFLTVRRLIDDGRLGRVHRFVSRIDRLRPVKPGWSTSVATGGGTLLDLGSHLIDQAVQLFGPVARLHAQLRAIRPGSGSEDEIELHLEHVGGVYSTLAAGMASAAEGPRFQVQGTVGGYLVTGFDIQETQLKTGGNPNSLGSEWGVEPPSAFGQLTTADGTMAVPSERGRWPDFYPATAAAFAGTASVPVDPEDAVLTARIIDAARVSAAEQRVVEL